MIELNLTPEQLQALGLTAEQEVTSETFTTALDAALAKAAGGEAHGQQLTDLQAQLTTLTAERDAAGAKLKEIEEAASMAEVDALLADYDLPEESASAMRDLALANRDQANALLGGMRKKEMKAPSGPTPAPSKKEPVLPEDEAGDPPPPMHDPKGKPEESPKDKVAEAEKLIAEIRKEKPVFSSYTAARTEARRRKPELFS